jgi:1,4-dihydroxy-2-naphthoate octaprenyltransferase
MVKEDTMASSKIVIWLRQLRAPFFSAAIIPVLVGTALAYSVAGVFNPFLFILALVGMVAFQAGANISNDYFDHTTGNDWLNENVTPFSGGSRIIQKHLLSPKSVLIGAWIALFIGLLAGAVMLYLTRSVFILILGIIGLLGAYFYTAPPVRLGYRGIGEVVIGFLFGLLPVYGSYYLQTSTIDLFPLIPGLIVGMLIFLIILINEFPDFPADAAVNKKTLVVVFGDKKALWVFKSVLAATFIIAGISLFLGAMFIAGLLYLAAFPLALLVLKYSTRDIVKKSGGYDVNKFTAIFHMAGGVALSLGFLISGILNLYFY